jgi:hypothetical protein
VPIFRGKLPQQAFFARQSGMEVEEIKEIINGK